MKRVSYVFPVSHRFRLRFHELVREQLAKAGIDYRVVYCDPPEANRLKEDTVDIPWGIKVGQLRLPGTHILYQLGLIQALRSDLVIVQQENRLLLNYPLQVASMLGFKRVAFFGHGRNYQSRRREGLSERWKRFWATRIGWWFGYTEETRQHIESLGFPSDRITVFNNAVDTTTLVQDAAAATSDRLAHLRMELGLTGDNISVFVGGLYADKRLDFLLVAATRIRADIRDFELIVVGGGPWFDRLRALAAGYPWIHVLGPRFGREKVEIMLLGKLFLMPGLVGLAVLDALALGLPMITTAYPHHSPEIAYLEPGVTGEIVADWDDPQAYADAVVALLRNPDRLQAMAAAAKESAKRYTVEAMAKRVASGVLAALGEIRE